MAHRPHLASKMGQDLIRKVKRPRQSQLGLFLHPIKDEWNYFSCLAVVPSRSRQNLEFLRPSSLTRHDHHQRARGTNGQSAHSPDQMYLAISRGFQHQFSQLHRLRFASLHSNQPIGHQGKICARANYAAHPAPSY